MASFDFSKYDPSDETEYKSPSKKEVKQPAKASFDFAKYDDSENEKPYALQYSHLTRKEYRELPLEKKAELQNYNPLTGVAKGFLSGATLGGSEQIPGLKIQEHEVGSGLGEFAGVTVPIGIGSKIIGTPIRAIGRLMNFGKVASAATDIGASASIGAGYGAAKEGAKATRGEDIDPTNIAIEAALFGGLHGLVKAGSGTYNWIKGLKPAQQSEILVDGVIPADLTPNQYEFFEQEVIPKLRKNAETEFEQSLTNAVEENNLYYKQELANTQAKHEQDLLQKQQAGILTEQENAEIQKQYQNKLKNIAAKHESQMTELQKENTEAQRVFQEQQKDFQRMKARQQAVLNAIKPSSGGQSLDGRISTQAEGLPFRPAPPIEVRPTLDNRVGNTISPNEITNTTNAGRANIEAVRANDAIDYQAVNDAYRLSDQLNEQVNSIQPTLIQDLLNTANNIRAIPQPSPPQTQLLGVIEKTLARLGTFENGNLTGLLDINNRVLQEQAKSLRHFMDFNFEHGNTRGIFSPTVRQLENAIEFGARSTGNEAAAEANLNARRMYAQWADAYDNPYIRPYRDTRNFDYSKTFKGSLDIDEFNMLNSILSRSNAGQQLAGSTRRALVEKQLEKFMENPRRVNPKEFDKTLRELQAVISPEQTLAIRQEFNQARRTPVINAKKNPKIEEAKAPKVKEIDVVEIGKVPSKKSPPEPIQSVKIPNKKPLSPTPEMKGAAKKMKVTPEEIMKLSNTPSGLRAIKEDLSKSTEWEKIYERIGKQKVRDILFEGNVQRQFNGSELYKIINKGENYAMLSEILGEDAAAELLVTSKQIGEKKATVEALKKYGAKVGTIKAALLFGIL